jgi:hypothetical protein
VHTQEPEPQFLLQVCIADLQPCRFSVASCTALVHNSEDYSVRSHVPRPMLHHFPSRASCIQISPGELSFDCPENLHVHMCSSVINHAYRAGKLVIVVTHGGFLGRVYHACVGHSKRGLVRNCSIGEVHVGGSTRAVVRWNEVSHLSESSDNPSAFTTPEVL